MSSLLPLLSVYRCRKRGRERERNMELGSWCKEQGDRDLEIETWSRDHGERIMEIGTWSKEIGT